MAQMRENRTKRKLQRGEVTTGVTSDDTPVMIDFLGSLGWDSVWIDAEHGPVDFGDVGNLSRACDLWGMTSLVRVNLNFPGVIYRVLDQGAQGVIVPHVNTEEEARAVVDAAKFAPIGHRGSGGGRQGFGVEGYFSQANEMTLVTVMIEEVAGLENLPEMLRVDNIDVYYIAPTDLAQSMGYLGQPSHPKVVSAVHRAIDQIIAVGKVAGTPVYDDNVADYIQRGVRYVNTSWPRWVAAGSRTFLERVANAPL